MDTNIVVIPVEALGERIEKIMRKVLNETKTDTFKDSIFSIHAAAKEIGIHSQTLQKMIAKGTIKATADGKRISGVEIENYLNNK